MVSILSTLCRIKLRFRQKSKPKRFLLNILKNMVRHYLKTKLKLNIEMKILVLSDIKRIYFGAEWEIKGIHIKIYGCISSSMYFVYLKPKIFFSVRPL